MWGQIIVGMGFLTVENGQDFFFVFVFVFGPLAFNCKGMYGKTNIYIWTNVVVVWLQTTDEEDLRTNGSPGVFVFFFFVLFLELSIYYWWTKACIGVKFMNLCRHLFKKKNNNKKTSHFKELKNFVLYHKRMQAYC